MKRLKRYEPELESRGEFCGMQEVEDYEGRTHAEPDEWCRASDVAELEERAHRLEGLLRAIVKRVEVDAAAFVANTLAELGMKEEA